LLFPISFYNLWLFSHFKLPIKVSILVIEHAFHFHWSHISVNFCHFIKHFKLCSIAQLLLKLLLVFRSPISEMHLEHRILGCFCFHFKWCHKISSVNTLVVPLKCLSFKIKGSVFSCEKTYLHFCQVPNVACHTFFNKELA
jgi:hypothetical protein